MKLTSCFILFFFFFCSVLSYSQSKTRIACVGNSITYGYKIENREINSYPAQLSAMLGEDYEVQNFGKSGATLLRKGKAPYWTSNEFKHALDFQPDWVFIKLGTNDSNPVNRIFLTEYVQDYKDLIVSFQQLPSHPRIVILLPTPVFLSDSTGITSGIITERITPMIRQVAYETGCEVINLYNLLIDSPQLFPDKVHPSAEGTALIAKRIFELVRMKSDPSFSLSKKLPQAAKPFNFYGFQGYDFTFRGRNAKIVIPKIAAPGHPWVWRARFWGHEPQTDIALLERGFHVVYCDVSEMFGNKQALSIWNDYYKLLTRAGLAKKSVMEGMSRGGVYIYRWAATYPKRVSAIYADAPVLDLKSWPGGKGKGKGKGKGSPETWDIFKKDFNIKSEDEATAFKGNPINLTRKLAKAGFPMLHVVGDADDVVPVAENTALFEQKIRDAGGSIQVIHKPGVGHHPHSLQNPQPIVDFILRATVTGFQRRRFLLYQYLN
jgi:lysophospholipase L1-like esterase/pimeloyl-ACP methyl ester carboxylesterase